MDVVDEGASSADVTSSVGTATGILGSGKSAPTYRYSRKKTPVVHLEKLNVTTDSNGMNMFTFYITNTLHLIPVCTKPYTLADK